MAGKTKGPITAVRYWWNNLTLRWKIIIFEEIVIGMIAFISIFSIVMVTIRLQDFSNMIDDCYDVNNVINDYSIQTRVFQLAMDQRNATTLEEYYAARQTMETNLNNLSARLYENYDSFVLISQISAFYGSYNEECDQIIAHAPDGQPFLEAYYKAERISNLLEERMAELLQAVIDNGNLLYNQNRQRLSMFPVGTAIWSLVFTAITLFLCAVMMRQAIAPVTVLTEASQEIAKGNYDIPDIPTGNNTEMGQLIAVFNQMKHASAVAISSLREINKIEHKLHAEELQRINAERLLDDMRLAMLQSQINPHFLFNTLNVISRTAQAESAPETETLILKLSQLFRYSLQDSGSSINLQKELKIVEAYLSIQQTRFGERICYQIESDPETLNVDVPVFILQPLVENAVIHGIGTKEEGGAVRVRARMADTGLVITIVDNGVGIPRNRLKDIFIESGKGESHLSGLGLKNVQARLSLVFPGSTLAIKSRSGIGTVIRITIPISPVPCE